ncbi:VOC family protein [Paenibacillus sp. SEL1]
MKFNKVVLWINEFEDMKGFYSKLDYLIADDKDDNEFTVYMGYTQVVFKKADDRFLAQYGKPYYHIAINIPENTFAEAKKRYPLKSVLLKRITRMKCFLISGILIHSILRIRQEIS